MSAVLTAREAANDLLSPRRELARAWLLAGTLLVLIVAVGALVELPVAVIAPGKLVVDGQRKPVQHLEGGIVREVRVREGDPVRAGDTLMVLETTRAQAESASMEQRLVHLRAVEARLAAEERRAAQLTLPPGLIDQARRAGATPMIDAQRELFASRRRALDERLAALDVQRRELERRRGALTRQAEAVERQIALSTQERDDYRRLMEGGYGLKTKLLELERRIEALHAALSESRSDEAMVAAQLTQTTLDRDQALREYVEAAAGKRAEIAPDIATLEQQSGVARDQLARAEVRAPVDGIAHDVRRLGVGSVVQPGDRLLDIVPASDALIVEAQVDPGDVEDVRVGQEAFVRVHSRLRSRTIEVPATVAILSPDRYEPVDGAVRQPGTPAVAHAHYIARLRIAEGDADAANGGELRPGMTVEAHVVTGSRSPLGLMMQPLTDGFTRVVRQR